MSNIDVQPTRNKMWNLSFWELFQKASGYVLVNLLKVANTILRNTEFDVKYDV